MRVAIARAAILRAATTATTIACSQPANWSLGRRRARRRVARHRARSGRRDQGAVEGAARASTTIWPSAAATRGGPRGSPSSRVRFESFEYASSGHDRDGRRSGRLRPGRTLVGPSVVPIIGAAAGPRATPGLESSAQFLSFQVLDVVDGRLPTGGIRRHERDVAETEASVEPTEHDATLLGIPHAANRLDQLGLARVFLSFSRRPWIAHGHGAVVAVVVVPRPPRIGGLGRRFPVPGEVDQQSISWA